MNVNKLYKHSNMYFVITKGYIKPFSEYNKSHNKRSNRHIKSELSLTYKQVKMIE